jgi:glycosyltransferase involved in cell wall biosynthesis
MVARMAPPKRPDLLLHALALVRDATGAEIPATLAGDGPDLAAHQALARRLGLEAVEFTGLCTDVPGLLARHGVFVLLSDHEGLPISVIEAMRAGLAIVASDLPGLRELLPTTAQGLRVPNDARAVAAALQRLAHDPALRAALGRAARQRYEQAHTPAHMAQAVLDIYRHSAAP